MEQFPILVGLTFDLEMTPNFTTSISTVASGNEVRTPFQQYARWLFKLTYEYLPNNYEAGQLDLQTILGFFLKRRGSFEPFLFLGPETPTESETLLGVGDGSTSSFQLVKTVVGGYTEPAGGVMDETDVEVYLGGTFVPPANYSLDDYRNIVFATPPNIGVAVTATYIPLYRVRFNDDSIEFNQFMSRLWELQEVSLRSVL